MLTASRERGVIGGREIDAQHPEDRCQDALGLTQRSVEDETERQGGFDGEIGILEWPAPPADASRCPRGDRVRREPEGDVASPHEGSVVLGPVPDAIRCRVLRMHSRLHIEIMTRRRSRWSTGRPLLAHRAESAHQRRVRYWRRSIGRRTHRTTDRWLPRRRRMPCRRGLGRLDRRVALGSRRVHCGRSRRLSDRLRHAAKESTSGGQMSTDDEHRVGFVHVGDLTLDLPGGGRKVSARRQAHHFTTFDQVTQLAAAHRAVGPAPRGHRVSCSR